MQYAVAVLALAAGASAASYPVAGNATSYTTSVVTSTEIYCSEATTLTYGTQTYEVTTPTTLTITDCPVTVVTPVYSTSAPSSAPVYPTIHQNGTTTAATTTYAHPTGSVPPATTAYPTTAIPTAAAGKLVAGMAGVLAAVAAAL